MYSNPAADLHRYAAAGESARAFGELTPILDRLLTIKDREKKTSTKCGNLPTGFGDPFYR